MKSIENITLKDLFNVDEKFSQINLDDHNIIETIPDLKDWLIAGKITAYLLLYGKTFIKNEATLLSVYEAISEKFEEIKKISTKELLFAFPINISLNDCAAHDTPSIDDTREFDNDVVKLDLGISVNGCIGDSAITIDLSGNFNSLLNASKIALEKAIIEMKDGNSVSKVGEKIEQEILSQGFVPIRNLSGHRIEHYNLHSGKNIPNFNSKEETRIEYGEIYAVEPFATNGAGLIENSGTPEIFRLTARKKTRNNFTREILKTLEPFRTLPFSKLELYLLNDSHSLGKINFALREMRTLSMIEEYAQLIEVDNGVVSQHEHTIIVGKKAIITTVLE